MQVFVYFYTKKKDFERVSDFCPKRQYTLYIYIVYIYFKRIKKCSNGSVKFLIWSRYGVGMV